MTIQTYLDSPINNPKLKALLTFMQIEENLEIRKDGLIGEWDYIQPGQEVTITFIDPYRIKRGFVFTLPGFGNFWDSAIVQVVEEEDSTWYPLKMLVALCETIEL